MLDNLTQKLDGNFRAEPTAEEIKQTYFTRVNKKSMSKKEKKKKKGSLKNLRLWSICPQELGFLLKEKDYLLIKATQYHGTSATHIYKIV